MTTRRTPTRFSAFAVTAPGLAPFTSRELEAFGVTVRDIESAGVAFDATLRDVVRANVHLRTASRVLVRVDEFRAATFHELAKRTARIPWREWLSPGRTVQLRVTCRKSRLYHSGAVAERVTAALAPYASVIGNAMDRDDSDAASADADVARADASDAWEPGGGVLDVGAQLVVVRLLNDRCTISLDSSGALLHQRGYRQATAKAPMRETLGAALLMASGWKPGTPLVDPFCGSGTLAIEGAMLARHLAPGRARDFAVSAWPGVERQLVEGVRAEARDGERPSAGAPIVASDRDAGAIEAARSNARRAGVADDIHFHVRPVSALVPPAGDGGRGTIVTNPPYGVRVSPSGELRNLYARAGAVLRQHFAGWRLAVVSADPRLTAQLGLPLHDEVQTNNGGLTVRFAVGTVPV